jgi:hypothetical protein
MSDYDVLGVKDSHTFAKIASMLPYGLGFTLVCVEGAVGGVVVGREEA